MGVLNNIRWEKFAQSIASGMSQRRSYRAAFPNSEKWKDETVDVKASELMKNGKVLVRVKEIGEKASNENIMNVMERKEWLTGIIKTNEEKTSDRLKAVYILNRMEGAYVEKVEVSSHNTDPFDGLTTEELRQMIDDD